VFAAGLGGGEGQHGDADVGVELFVVGVGVVGVVLGDPPAEADPDQQVAVEEPGQVVGPAATEDLAVAGVVADEGQLGGHHGQVDGGEQLPPGVTQEKENHQAGGEECQVEADPGRVPAVPSVQQPGLLDLPGEVGVLAPAALARWRAGSERSVESGHEGSSGRRWNGGPGSGSLANGSRPDRFGCMISMHYQPARKPERRLEVTDR
jgi:hypothetical protein